MKRRVSWFFAWMAMVSWIFPAPLLHAGDPPLETAVRNLEFEVHELKREVKEVKDLNAIAVANAKTIDLEMKGLREEVDALALGNAEMRKKIYDYLEAVNAAAEDGKILLCELQELNGQLKQLNCELCQLNCQLKQLNCELACLPEAIYRAKFRAFVIGVLVGVGIGVAAGGGGGGVGLASVGVW